MEKDAKRATFAGDQTGAVGNTPTPQVAIDTLPHEPEPPETQWHSPGKSSTTVEDPGWVKEEQGSALAQEREGVPEGEIPHNLPDSATRERRKA